MLGFRVRESGGVLENYRYKFTIQIETSFESLYIIFITLCFSVGERKKQERFFC